MTKPTLTPLYDPEKGRMRVAGFMSTKSGSNLRKLIDHSMKAGINYDVAVIFSDRNDSAATIIGKDYGIPVVLNDKREFYARHGIPTKDSSLRGKFDMATFEKLKPYNIHMAALAGYMSLVSDFLIDSLLLVNVHPADLNILNQERKRKYTGEFAVKDQILAGEKEIRSTTHIIDKGDVDSGRILMVSNPSSVILSDGFNPQDPAQLKSVGNENQGRLKEIGDWVIYPRTLEYIAIGRFQQDERGNLYFDSKPIPEGLQSSY